jgi:hypothetical protein
MCRVNRHAIVHKYIAGFKNHRQKRLVYLNYHSVCNPSTPRLRVSIKRHKTCAFILPKTCLKNFLYTHPIPFFLHIPVYKLFGRPEEYPDRLYANTMFNYIFIYPFYSLPISRNKVFVIACLL